MPLSAKPSSVSPLDSHLGYWLRLVSNDVSHSFRLKVESRGVTVAEWVVMRALFEGDGVNPSQLADQIGLTRGAISKLVERLFAKGIARIVAEKKDRRFQTVSLTSAGRKLVPQLAAMADLNDAEVFGFLGVERRGELVRLLREIAERRGISGAPVD